MATPLVDRVAVPAGSLRTYAASYQAVLSAVAVTLLAAVLTVWSVMHLQGYAPDDAFITYRVADHLASGHGWAYNAGEGTANAATSPLYTALLALGALVYANIPRLGTMAFVAGILLAAVCTFLLLRRVATPAAAWISVPLITLNPWFASTRGMESGLFLGLTSATLLSVTAGRLFLAGALAGATTLVRGEGILLCAIIGIHAIATMRRIPWRLIAGGLTVIGPWLLYSLVSMGTALPDTLAAKMAQGASGFWGEGFIFLEGWIPLISANGALQAWGIGLGLLATVGVAHWALHRTAPPSLLMLTVFAVGFVAVYGLVLNVPGYHWYYSLPVFWVTVLAAIGAGHLWLYGISRRDSLHLSVGVLATTVVIAAGWAGFLQGGNGYDYIVLGEWLQEHSDPGDRIAASEIGYIGWTVERPIVDYLGLLSAESVEELRNNDMVDWVRREEPDYWVRFDPPIPVEQQLAAQVWFPHAFERVHQHSNLAIYERVRSDEEAEALAQQALERDAGEILDGWSGAGAVEERAARGALAALLRAVAERQDLHEAFISGEDLHLGQLIRWGATAAGAASEDRHQLALAEHQETLTVLGGAVANEARVPTSSLEVLQTDLLRWWRTGEYVTTDG